MKVSACTHRPILSPCGLQGFQYQLDTYIGCEHYCHYCYALAQAETDWSKEILIHNNIVDQLSEELEKLSPQNIYMGYYTDPYQPSEAQYHQTRKVLALLLSMGFSASILTKSDTVVQDIEILKAMNDAAVSVSVAFNDNQTRRLFEANTIETENRIDALRQLKQAGVKTGALICPVVPYITDVIQLVDMVVPYADVIWIYGLSINDPSGQNWLNVQKIISRHFSELAGHIEPAVLSKDHRYWAQLRADLAALKKDRELNLHIHL